MEVVADRVCVLIKTGKHSDSEKRVLLEAISDLRAAYCSFCNKALCRDSAGKLDAEVSGTDEYKNKKWRCILCTRNK
jgi:uncharacterized protein with PIN domain